MRDRLIDELDTVPRQRFLVYLMGPYEEYGEDESEALDRLFHLRDRLRVDPGVNAFLAIDATVPLEEMDAATQSVEFARASNVVAFVAPDGGQNLGVGIEAGSILERIYDEKPRESQERIVFAHEESVSSAMIESLSRRWDVTVFPYADIEELVEEMQEFVSNVVSRELTGEIGDSTEEAKADFSDENPP